MSTAERLRRASYPLLVLAVNVAVAWRLFRTEYLDQMPSIEGAFISLATYIRHHWPGYDWFPVWYGGFPFSSAYQPLFHYTVAVAAALSGASPARAYHWIAGIGYALGGVAFYALARSLKLNRGAACLGALTFSLFSPSLLFLTNARIDAGGFSHARRLQAMVVYGEMPNVTGLAIGMFALALLIRALDSERGWRWIAAALCLAAVPAANWPATVSLLLAVGCYVASFDSAQLKARGPRLLVIGCMAALMALPFALPSTVLSTFHNANRMGDGPTHGAARWLALAAILFCCALVRALTARGPRELRFPLLFSALLAGIVLTSAYADIRVIPQAFRFHLSMEIALTLLATVVLSTPRWRRYAAAAAILFCCVQFYRYRSYARTIIRPVNIQQTIEHEEARWFDDNMHGSRVLAPGSVSFWMNAWTETPQMAGCCEQSLLSDQDFIEAYITAAGYGSNAESADFATLWMKAWAVAAVAVPGPHSREAFRTVLFPSRYEGRLSRVWSEGDDWIYRVPERVPGLARVVPASALVSRPPENGIDAVQLRPFVAALDDAYLPSASWAWNNPNSATARAAMTQDQALSIAINYDPGWTAKANGRSVPLERDGLGLIAIRPGCSGDCRVEVQWSAGMAPVIAWILAGSTLLLGAVWVRR